MNPIRQCRHGIFEFLERDQLVGRSLEKYGEFSEQEVRLYRDLLRPGDWVVEVGAHIGAHTVPLGQIVGPSGRVLAFEPQSQLYEILCRNLWRNQICCAFPFNCALGNNIADIGLPRFDYGAKDFMASCLGWDKATPLIVDGAPVTEWERRSLTMLDAFRLPRCDFIKIDVDGAESEVLRGACWTIEMNRPVLYVENDTANRSHELISLLLQLQYELYWDQTPLFLSTNWNQYADNIFGNLGSIMMLCIPRERVASLGHISAGIPIVNGPDDMWRRQELMGSRMMLQKII